MALIEISGSLAYDSMPCQPSDAGYALTALSKSSDIAEYGWEMSGIVWWTVDVKKRERESAHLAIRRSVEKAISTHTYS